MNENHQDKTESELSATKDEIWLPPLSLKEQKKVDQFQKKPFAERMGIAGKTPWDLVQLLIIPLVLLGIGFLFNYEQNQANQRAAATRYANDQQLAADQQRETTLQTCLDNIKDLLLNKSLRASKPQDEVRVVARVEVLATLRQLDGGHKGLLIRFLSDAGLINSSSNDVIINLGGADLGGANLGRANLSRANLSYASMTGADLSHANLFGAQVTDVQLNTAKSLQGATMPDGTVHP